MSHNPNASQQPYQRYEQPPFQTSQESMVPSIMNQPINNDSKTMTAIAHFSAPVLYLVSAGTLSMFAPLVMYFIYRDKDQVVAAESAKAFNFQITMWIISIVAWMLMFTVILIPLSAILILLAGLASIIFGVIAGLKMMNGQAYEYPFSWNLIK